MIKITQLLTIKTKPKIRICDRESTTYLNEFYAHVDFDVDINDAQGTIKLTNRLRDWSSILLDVGIQDIEVVLGELKDGEYSEKFSGVINGGSSNQSITNLEIQHQTIEQKKIPFVTLSPPLANNLAKPGSRITFGDTTYILE